MLHIVAGHLDLMRPHEEVKMIVVEELLGDVFSEHGSRLAARGLASLAVHGDRTREGPPEDPTCSR